MYNTRCLFKKMLLVTTAFTGYLSFKFTRYTFFLEYENVATLCLNSSDSNINPL